MRFNYIFNFFKILKPELTSSKKSDLIFLIVLLAGSLSLNVSLGWKLHRTSVSSEAIKSIAEGESVYSFNLTGISDNLERAITFKVAEKSTVLYVMSPSCHWCIRNHDNINALANSRNEQYRFIAISLSDQGLKEYLEINKYSFPVFKNISRKSAEQMKLGSTPQTLVVSSDGKVLKNWIGAYNPQLQSEIETYFKVKLPGLTSK